MALLPELVSGLRALLTDPSARTVLAGTALLAAASALVGTFALLRKRALVGDAVAHALLPGVCLAFLVEQTKNPWALLAGAAATGWLSLWAIDALARRTRLKEDTAIALVLSVFFGVGILLLTAIQQSGVGTQSGLDKFLFGKAASLTRADLWAFGAVAAALLTATVLFYKEWQLLAFDPAFAAVTGLPVRALERGLRLMSVLAVVVGIQAVGVVLMAAMLITPAAAARYWTDRLPRLLGLAAAFGVVASLAGTAVSFIAPRMPTGPWIVLWASTLAMLSVGLAPRRGLLARLWRQHQVRALMLRENLLKALAELAAAHSAYGRFFSADEIYAQRALPLPKLRRGLRRLARAGLAETDRRGGYRATGPGLAQGRRVWRLHLLWEAYLTSALRLRAATVHDDAETLEHLITPELEADLEAELAARGLRLPEALPATGHSIAG